MEPVEGDVIAAYGRSFLVQLRGSGSRLSSDNLRLSGDDSNVPDAVMTGESTPIAAVTRGRKADIVVGDRVLVRQVSADQAVIESVAPRRNLVRRSDHWRSKSIAANLDQAAVVVSGHPAFDEALLLRISLALAAEGIPLRVIVTKTDLVDETHAIQARLSAWRAIGTPIDQISLRGTPQGLDALRAALVERSTLLLGQSGMGKSTLINALVPDAEQRTNAISEALASGRHTTTFSRAFPLAQGGTIIDSPGFQTFEIAHLSSWERAHAMPEFASLLGKCRFNDCQHRDEPGCAIRAAERSGAIDAIRYRLFGAIE